MPKTPSAKKPPKEPEAKPDPVVALLAPRMSFPERRVMETMMFLASLKESLAQFRMTNDQACQAIETELAKYRV